ncbi:MAG: ABC transporter permease [Xenophilus sp.]
MSFARGARPWLSILFLLVVWWIAGQAGWLNTRILPGPWAVAKAFATLVGNGQLARALAASLPRVGWGLLIGAVSGVLLGFAAGYWRIGEDLIDRPLQALKAIPFTALTPLFILWFGIGELPKVLLVVVGVAVPLYLNTYSGIRGVDRKFVEVAHVYDGRSLVIARDILLPGALPHILTGLRYGLSIGWVALIVAESIAASTGIGFLLTNARQYSQTDVVIVCILVYALLGVITDLIVRQLERSLLRWRLAIH